MPAIPEGLYTSSLRDQLSPGLEIFLRDVSVSAAAGTVTADINVPNDRILILSAATVRANFTAGVGNSMTGMQGQISGPEPVDMITIMATGTTAAAVNVTTALAFSGEVWIPASGIVRGVATFAVADASNTVLLEVAGVLIPRGNVLSAGG